MNIISKADYNGKNDCHKREATAIWFYCRKRANKLQIKDAVKDIYGVEVVSVNTMNYTGKRKSRFTKTGVIAGKVPAFKKAVVTLAEGETIDFFSNI
jgi:large subunit ribosomal protein L23